MRIGVPPFDEHDDSVDREDLEYQLLPESLKKEIDAAWEDPDSFTNKPCIWLDLETRLCKHYDFRPVVCAMFEPGNWVCIEDREIHLDADEPQEISLFESGVILAGCVVGMALIIVLAWIF